jgi:hypothetical protein
MSRSGAPWWASNARADRSHLSLSWSAECNRAINPALSCSGCCLKRSSWQISTVGADARARQIANTHRMSLGWLRPADAYDHFVEKARELAQLLHACSCE